MRSFRIMQKSRWWPRGRCVGHHLPHRALCNVLSLPKNAPFPPHRFICSPLLKPLLHLCPLSPSSLTLVSPSAFPGSLFCHSSLLPTPLFCSFPTLPSRACAPLPESLSGFLVASLCRVALTFLRFSRPRLDSPRDDRAQVFPRAGLGSPHSFSVSARRARWPPVLSESLTRPLPPANHG